MTLSRRHIRDGEKFPIWYGLAYYRFDTGETVCYPIPFNFFVGWVQRLRTVIKCGPQQDWWICLRERWRQEGYNEAISRMRRVSEFRGWDFCEQDLVDK